MRPRVAILALLAVLVPAQAARGQANLVANGDFEAGFKIHQSAHFLDAYPGDRIPRSWTPIETFSTSGGLEYSAYLPSAKTGGGKELRFIRTEYSAVRTGDITGVYQDLATAPKAEACASLALRLDVKVNSHDLLAGGFVSPAWEWPAYVQIDYLTTAGQTQVWRHGWYANPPGDGTRVVDPGTGLISEFKDTPMTAGRYGSYQFELLQELPQLDRLQRITLGGAGWSFDGAIDNVAIVCRPSVARLLTQRFEVSMEFRVSSGSAFQRATAVPVSDCATLFWFFTADNPEILVKVLDSCDNTGSFWVFVGGLTNAETRVRIKDRASGEERLFQHTYGGLIKTALDDRTFDACHLDWP